VKIEINLHDQIEEGEVFALYYANEWSSAKKPNELMAGLRNSHSLVTARISKKLVGLGNAISDAHLVVYYPHMLVHPDYHGQAIGCKMMDALQTVYGNFNQQMLTADRSSIDFYEKLGFERAGETEPMWIYDSEEH
jgi:predicted GNAT family N-acyltransferase